MTLSASAGTFAPAPGQPTSCASPPPQTQSLTVEAAAPGSYSVVVEMRTATGTPLPPVVLDLVATA